VDKQLHPRATFYAARVHAVSGHEFAKTYDCKVPGCDQEASKGRGPYAFLCDFHVTEAQRKARLARQNGGGLDQAASETAAVDQFVPAETTGKERERRWYQSRAMALVEEGERLDAAAAAFEEAQQRWDAAVAQLGNIPR
jgi:hypothetical protein